MCTSGKHHVTLIRVRQCRVFSFKSSGARRQFPRAWRKSRLALRRRHPGRYDHSPGAIERALAQFESEQAVGFERTG
jgi:hypothetical protein